MGRWSRKIQYYNAGPFFLISASMTLNNRSSTTRVLVSVRRNSNAIIFNEGFWSAQVNTTQVLLVGDYIELFVQHSGASSANIITTAETHFALTLLGYTIIIIILIHNNNNF